MRITLNCTTDGMEETHHPQCPQTSMVCPLLGGVGYIDVADPVLPQDTTHQHDDKYSKLTHDHDAVYDKKGHIHLYGNIMGIDQHHHKTWAYTKNELRNILQTGKATYTHTLKCHKPIGTMTLPNYWQHDEYCGGKDDPNCPLNGGKGTVSITIDPAFYSKAEVDQKIANANISGGGGSVDLSNYYTKTETYSRASIDAKVQSSYVTISSALRDRVKTMLNLSLTATNFDTIVDQCITISAGLISRYVGLDTVPSELEFVLVECSIVRYNRIGSEGLTSEGIDGYSVNFISDILQPYHLYLNDYIARNSSICNSAQVLRTL